METQTFEELLRKTHEEKLKKQSMEFHHREIYGENIYSKFRFWCRVFVEDYEKARTDVKQFARFIKEEHIQLTFTQRKNILEKYFGYKFEFNNEKKEWSAKKL